MESSENNINFNNFKKGMEVVALPDVDMKSMLSSNIFIIFLYVLLFGIIAYFFNKLSKRFGESFTTNVKKAIYSSNIEPNLKGKDSYFFGNVYLKVIFIVLLIINFIVFIIYNFSYIGEVNLNNAEDKMYISTKDKININKLKTQNYISKIIETINYYSGISLLIFIIISTIITNRIKIQNFLNNYVIKLVTDNNKLMLRSKP